MAHGARHTSCYSGAMIRSPLLAITFLGLGCAAPTRDFTPNPNDDSGADAAPDTGPHGTLGPENAMRMFVTSAPYKGNVASEGVGDAHAPEWSGGADAADRLCASAASNAGLGGSWKAWISDSTAFGTSGAVKAIDRIEDRAGGWYNVDRTAHPFASKAALAGAPNPAEWQSAPDKLGDTVSFIKDENGNVPGRLDRWSVWTGTAAGGTGGASDCKGWATAQFQNSGAPVGVVGVTNGAPSQWTDDEDQMCALDARLYCFEQ